MFSRERKLLEVSALCLKVPSVLCFFLFDIKIWNIFLRKKRSEKGEQKILTFFESCYCLIGYKQIYMIENSPWRMAEEISYALFVVWQDNPEKRNRIVKTTCNYWASTQRELEIFVGRMISYLFRRFLNENCKHWNLSDFTASPARHIASVSPSPAGRSPMKVLAFCKSTSSVGQIICAVGYIICI